MRGGIGVKVRMIPALDDLEVKMEPVTAVTFPERLQSPCRLPGLPAKPGALESDVAERSRRKAMRDHAAVVVMERHI